MRAAFAAITGLGNDESYTIVTSRDLALSYFDHPPMTWWLAHLSSWLAGSEVSIAVRAPFLAFATLSTVLMYSLTAKLFDRWSGVLAALMMACAPVLGVTSASWILPDGPLITFLLVTTLVLVHVLFDSEAHPAGWLLAGLLGGLALLSKYHGIFLFAGTFLFLLTSPAHRFWLRSIWPYAGALVGLIVFFPVVIWNVQHDFVSIAFQESRATVTRFQPWMALVAIAGTALFLTPWIWLGLVTVGWRAACVGPKAPRAWLLLCLGIGPVLLFPLVAVWSAAKPFFHWAAPGYLLLFPLLGAAVARQWGKRPTLRHWVLGSVTFVTIAMIAVMAVSLAPGFAALGAGALRDPLRELAPWSGLAEAFHRNGLSREKYAFVVSRVWYEGGKIGYALGDNWPVACIGIDCRGFSSTHVEEGGTGKDAVIVVPADQVGLANIRLRFAKLEPVETIEIQHEGALVERLQILIGRNYLAEGAMRRSIQRHFAGHSQYSPVFTVLHRVTVPYIFGCMFILNISTTQYGGLCRDPHKACNNMASDLQKRRNI